MRNTLLNVALVACAVIPALTAAAPITAGNLVIYRVGDGSAALAATSTSVFIDEYTTSGTLVQSIAVGSSMSAVGNASTEGIISASQDGTKLVFGGYRAATGLSSSNTISTNKVIGFVGLDGLVDTTTDVADAGNTTMRSATTVNGSDFYIGTSGSVRYVGSSGPAATSVVIDARNSRQVQLFGSVLYASNGSTAVTNKVQSYGTLPTTLTAPTGVVTLASSAAVNGFVMLDLDASVSGVDTAYAIATTANQVLKYTFDGSAWNASGAVAAGSANNLVALMNGSDVELYLTSTTKLMKMVDGSGYNGTLTSSTSDLALAATNTAFRGIGSLNTVPEPASMIALGLGIAALARRRRASR